MFLPSIDGRGRIKCRCDGAAAASSPAGDGGTYGETDHGLVSGPPQHANGTLHDDELEASSSDHGFLFGVSVDGHREADPEWGVSPLTWSTQARRTGSGITP